jgi:cation:H+ antiporter
MILLYIFYILISLVLLWKGSGLLVDSAVRIACWMGVSQLVIGLTIVAFGTSAPEFVVTIGAALNGQADISVSNVIGSNIYNLGFILGSVAMIQAVQADWKLIYRDGLILVLISLILVWFLHDLHLTRFEGTLLLIGLIAYNIFLIRQKEPADVEDCLTDSIRKDWLFLVLALIMVIAGGNLLRMGSVGLARHLGVSDWVIGVTLIAGGTSAPEFATSLMASFRGHHGISAGNLVGSCIFNVLGVLGIAGFLRPMKMASDATLHTLLMTGIVILSLVFFRTGWKISRLEGVAMIILSFLIWFIILSR